MTVYIIHCSANKKYYVGQTIQKSLRQYMRHKWNHARACIEKNNHIYSAMRKYPFESFSITPLGVCSAKYEMDQLEKLWIIALNSRDDRFGMNLAVGGEGGWFGMKHSKESIQKMKANPNRPKGFPTEEHRRAHSAKMKGAGNPMFGKKRIMSEEWIRKIAISNTGRKHSEETKLKMSLAAKARWMK